jgi:hypothetical protein
VVSVTDPYGRILGFLDRIIIIIISSSSSIVVRSTPADVLLLSSHFQ